MLVCDGCFMYKLLIDHVPLASVCSLGSHADSLHPGKQTQVLRHRQGTLKTITICWSHVSTAASARSMMSDTNHEQLKSMNHISYLDNCGSVFKVVPCTYLIVAAWAGSPAASRTSDNAAPAFVQLGVVGADVAPYIPQSKERLTAELHSREGTIQG